MGAKSGQILNHSVPGALLNAEEIEDFAFVMGDAFSDYVLAGLSTSGACRMSYFGSL